MSFVLSCYDLHVTKEICCICEKSLEDTKQTVFFLSKEITVYLHSNCSECEICETKRNVELVDSRDVYISCKCEENCSKCGKPFFRKGERSASSFIDIDNNSIRKIHMKCKGSIYCATCSFSIKPEEIYVREKFYHHVNCYKVPCQECKNPLKFSDAQVLDSKRRIYYHNYCLEKKVCSKCTSPIGNFGTILGKDNKIYHAKDCNAGSCAICFKTIGPFPFNDVGNRMFHTECLKEHRCGSCGLKLKGTKVECLASDGLRVRHSHCPSVLCGKCKKPLEDSGSKFDQIMYHIFCTPKCYVCQSICSDNIKHQKTSLGYKCDQCNSAKCIECNKYIGKNPAKTVGIFLIHQKCVQKCCDCQDVSVRTTSFPPKFLSLGETPIGVPRKLRDKLFALVIANKKSRKLSRDVLSIILNMTFNSNQRIRSSIRNIHGLDLTEVCFPGRCKNFRCPICDSEKIYLPLDYKSCTRDSCSQVSSLCHKTSRFCFPEAEISERARDHDSVKELCKNFKAYSSSMNSEQKSFYAINASHIALLRTLHK